MFDPITISLLEKQNKLADNADNAALWRTATGNPATIYPVPKSRLYPRIELVATQEGSGDPSPENVRSIVASMQIGNVLRVTVGDGADEDHTYDLLTAEQDQYGVTGAPDIVDCETNLLTTNTALFSLPATGWSDANFAADGYFSIALSPAAAAAPTVLCSHFLPATTAAADSNKIVVSGATVKVYPADAVATDLAGWHTWLGSNAVKVIYQLSTATTSAITPPAVTALDRVSRTAARQNVLTVTANDAPVSKLDVMYRKSPIRESDELAAAIAALD